MTALDAKEKHEETLLLFYEEEIMGEAYFYGLIEHFSEQGKSGALAMMERRAADSIAPLLETFNLVPRDESTLREKGINWIKRHESFDWSELMTYMLNRYPVYLEDFKALDNLAPETDRGALRMLTNHEVAAIEFAEKELAGDPDSMSPLHAYLQ